MIIDTSMISMACPRRILTGRVAWSRGHLNFFLLRSIAHATCVIAQGRSPTDLLGAHTAWRQAPSPQDLSSAGAPHQEHACPESAGRFGRRSKERHGGADGCGLYMAWLRLEKDANQFSFLKKKNKFQRETRIQIHGKNRPEELVQTIPWCVMSAADFCGYSLMPRVHQLLLLEYCWRIS